MNGEVIHRALDGLSPAQSLQVPGHQIGFQGSRLVVVELTPLLVGQIVVAAIVVVVAENGHLIGKLTDQVVHQGGFSAAGAAGNADDQNAVFHV